MGIQAMASQGGGGSGGQQSQIQTLARQGSLYSLTLNEVQSHLGEPLNSMNLDELLKSVFPDEVNQPTGTSDDGTMVQCLSGSGLQSQGSITMPRILSKKTVDEVWRDIQQKKGSEDQQPERQPTLGEMTLEDFLIKAGIVAEGSSKKSNDRVGNVGPVHNTDPIVGVQDFTQGAAAHWLRYQQHQNMIGAYVPGHLVPQPMGVGAGPMLDAMYSDQQMSISSPSVGTMSDSQMLGRKRGASGEMAEKLVERRQKRMIKNRESAARSRARKQAYTNELENKVSRLEEENERLKKQKELENILFVLPPEPKYQLRRTSSASF